MASTKCQNVGKPDKAREKAIVWTSFNTGWKWITDRVVQSDLEFEVRKYSMTIENNELVFVKDRLISQCAIQTERWNERQEKQRQIYIKPWLFTRAPIIACVIKKVDVQIQCSCYKSSRLKWLVAPSYSAIHFYFGAKCRFSIYWCKMSIFHLFFALLHYWSIIFHWTSIKTTKQNSTKRPATNQITAELNCSCVSFAEILFFLSRL